MMSNDTMKKLLNYCEKSSPSLNKSLKNRFDHYIYNNQNISHNNLEETDLQIYLFFNFQKHFPDCTQVILHEQELIEGRTDLGKLDYLFLTKKCHIMIVETKLIDDERTGKQIRTNRNKKRNKVRKQVKNWKKSLSSHYEIPEKHIHCGIFTNDDFYHKMPSPDIIEETISNDDLIQWFKKENRFLKKVRRRVSLYWKENVIKK